MSVDFVAEVSSNHNRNLDRCFAFIEKAAEIGCYAVKFQLFKVDRLFSPEILENSELHRQRREWELPDEFLPELASVCKKAGLLFSCTPFYLEAVEQLQPYVDFYKIASYELLWSDLLIECAMTGKPVVVSTGMATMDEIRSAVKTLRYSSCKDLSLLHCVSGYPAPVREANLAALQTLRREFDVKTGWSDHTVHPGVIYRAVHKWDARMIEFHLDLEGEGMEYKSGHCWLPEQMREVIKNVAIGLETDGSGEKTPSESEKADRHWRADPVDGLRPVTEIRKKTPVA